MNTFWADKKIFITGGTGFIGTHLTSQLKEYGSEVTLLQGSITDEAYIQDVFEKGKFDVCFHLAAQPLVDIASNDPTPTFDVNIKGTWTILEAARKTNIKGIVIASSSHVYGDNNLPFLEEYFPRPSRPYETSKACADMIAQTYSTYYSLPVAIARCVNIYGPGDQNMRIVPRTIRLLLQGEQPEILSDETTRDYMFIKDAVDGYLTLAEKINELKKDNSNIVFNFGTGKHYSNVEVIEKIIQLMDLKDLKPRIIQSSRKDEIMKQYVSVEKAKKYLHWEPQYSLEEGLKQTIKWYTNLINK